MDDTALMLEAINLAVSARAAGNHPFGALLSKQGKVLLRSENTVVTSKDVTGHAELNLVRAASGTFSESELQKCTLYTSTEPCAMCAGAIAWSGIGKVVYGLSAEGLGELTGDHFVIPCRSLFDHLKRPLSVRGPVEEVSALVAHEGFWRHVDKKNK